MLDIWYCDTYMRAMILSYYYRDTVTILDANA